MTESPRIGIVAGSNRLNSESSRIARICGNAVSRVQSDASVEYLDLSERDIPVWNEDRWSPGSSINEAWAPFSNQLRRCEGYVFVVPEWAGMVPSQVKNLLLMCDKRELAHKPGLIVSISSGMGGAYPVSELRSSGYKNNQICWLPDHVIFRHVANLFVEPSPTDQDKELLDRLDYSTRLLVDFSAAFRAVRARNYDFKKYKYGM